MVQLRHGSVETNEQSLETLNTRTLLGMSCKQACSSSVYVLQVTGHNLHAWLLDAICDALYKRSTRIYKQKPNHNTFMQHLAVLLEAWRINRNFLRSLQNSHGIAPENTAKRYPMISDAPFFRSLLQDLWSFDPRMLSEASHWCAPSAPAEPRSLPYVVGVGTPGTGMWTFEANLSLQTLQSLYSIQMYTV